VATAHLVLDGASGEVGGKEGRRDRVDRDALLGPFDGERLGEADEAALGCRVRGDGRQLGRLRHAAEHRRDVDDPARTVLFAHHERHALCEEEGRLEVDCEQGIPLLLSHRDGLSSNGGTGVVHWHIHDHDLISTREFIIVVCWRRRSCVPRMSIRPNSLTVSSTTRCISSNDVTSH